MILIDTREKKSIEKALKYLGIPIERKYLDFGDYVIENIGIERKEVGDFLNSIYSHRIYDQLYGLSKSYERPILFVVGDIPPTHKWIRTRRRRIPVQLSYEEKEKRLKTIISNHVIAYKSYNIQVFFVPNEDRFVQYLAEFYYKSEKKEPSYKPIPRKAHSLLDIKTNIFGQIPGIGKKLANNLAKNYTVVEIATANPKALKMIKGIGDKTISKIKECLCQ